MKIVWKMWKFYIKMYWKMCREKKSELEKRVEELENEIRIKDNLLDKYVDLVDDYRAETKKLQRWIDLWLEDMWMNYIVTEKWDYFSRSDFSITY